MVSSIINYNHHPTTLLGQGECHLLLLMPEFTCLINLKILVACAVVVLTIKWKKTEFLAGLFFLLLYTIFDAMSIHIYTVLQKSFLTSHNSASLCLHFFRLSSGCGSP